MRMRGWLAAARGSGADMGPAAGVPKRRPGLYNNCSPFSFNNVFFVSSAINTRRVSVGGAGAPPGEVIYCRFEGKLVFCYKI